MDLAIIHYHLNRGGVTQVIVNQLRALAAVRGDAEARVSILYGGRREAFPAGLGEQLPGLALELRAVPALDYDGENAGPRAEDLAAELQSVLAERNFLPETTVLHVHNANLGKNLSLPGALRLLARRGYRLLAQIHDFAEDFRPDNYRRLLLQLADGRLAALAEAIYPQAPHIHYATLNGRDTRLLQAAGFPRDRLHTLPNPVLGLPRLPDRAAARAKLQQRLGVPARQNYVLYPVRGIRRKNLGEALLWSALAERRQTFGLTLPPINPVERPRYEGWKQCARELRLPFVFETGTLEGLKFDENLAAADRVLTTSVAEGFGMVFLEPWLSGLPLCGRDLPEVTVDFRAAGLKLDGLYAQLRVPVEETDRRRLLEDWRLRYDEVLAAFGQPAWNSSRFQRAADARLASGLVDFAALSHNLQQRLVERASTEPRLRGRLRELNPLLEDAVQQERPDRGGLVAGNAEVVRRGYSLEPSGRRLWGVYRQVGESPVADRFAAPPHGDLILQSFLDFGRLHPIRLEP